jgi:hypothetical protein
VMNEQWIQIIAAARNGGKPLHIRWWFCACSGLTYWRSDTDCSEIAPSPFCAVESVSLYSSMFLWFLCTIEVACVLEFRLGLHIWWTR